MKSGNEGKNNGIKKTMRKLKTWENTRAKGEEPIMYSYMPY
jgi:hypothetical protein